MWHDVTWCDHVFLIPGIGLSSFQTRKSCWWHFLVISVQWKEVKGSTTSCSVPGTSVRGSYPQPKSVMNQLTSAHLETQAAHGLKTEVSHLPWETITNMDIWGSLRHTERKEKWKKELKQGRCAFVLWSDLTCRVSLLQCIRKRERTATSKAQGEQGLVYRHTICCSNFLENICNQGIARARAERFGCPPCMCHFRGSCCGMCL